MLDEIVNVILNEGLFGSREKNAQELAAQKRQAILQSQEQQKQKQDKQRGKQAKEQQRKEQEQQKQYYKKFVNGWEQLVKEEVPQKSLTNTENILNALTSANNGVNATSFENIPCPPPPSGPPTSLPKSSISIPIVEDTRA